MKRFISFFALSVVSISAFAAVENPSRLEVEEGRITAPGYWTRPTASLVVEHTFKRLARFGKLYCGGIEGSYRREGVDPGEVVYDISDVGLCVDKDGVTRHVSDRVSAFVIKELEQELQQVAEADQASRAQHDEDRGGGRPAGNEGNRSSETDLPPGGACDG